MVTYPLNNIQYTAEDAELYNSTRTSGVFADDSFNYSVTGADNTIVIGTGIAWIKNGEFSGKVVAQKEALSLNLGLSNANYPRIDAVVIQFNANSNSTEIIVKNGTASSRPSAPAVVRTESVYELHLYHIHRNAGELSVSPSSITDLRGNDEYCGIMTDGVTKIDKTLTKDGYVADAKAVGDAISSATNISVPNTRTINGFRLDKNISLAAKNVGSAPAVESEEHSGCYYRMVGGTKEWINPPFQLGVEYRTTERWAGQAVYARLYDGGTAVHGFKTINYSIGAVHMVRQEGQVISDGFLETMPIFYQGSFDGTYSIWVHACSHERLVYWAGSEMAGRQVYIKLFYTKD